MATNDVLAGPPGALGSSSSIEKGSGWKVNIGFQPEMGDEVTVGVGGLSPYTQDASGCEPRIVAAL